MLEKKKNQQKLFYIVNIYVIAKFRVGPYSGMAVSSGHQDAVTLSLLLFLSAVFHIWLHWQTPYQ